MFFRLLSFRLYPHRRGVTVSTGPKEEIRGFI